MNFNLKAFFLILVIASMMIVAEIEAIRVKRSIFSARGCPRGYIWFAFGCVPCKTYEAVTGQKCL